jgi:hypothetical protein
MRKYPVMLNKAKKDFDKEDIRDFNDEVYRYIDELELEVKELKEQHKTEMEFSQKLLQENLQLMSDNEALKALIPHQVDERG